MRDLSIGIAGICKGLSLTLNGVKGRVKSSAERMALGSKLASAESAH